MGVLWTGTLDLSMWIWGICETDNVSGYANRRPSDPMKAINCWAEWRFSLFSVSPFWMSLCRQNGWAQRGLWSAWVSRSSWELGKFWNSIRDIPELFPPLPPSREDLRLPLPAADLEAAERRLGLVTELGVLWTEFCSLFFILKKGPIRRL